MHIIKINWGLFREQPYNAEVWGSVSDWATVWVTFATAALLLLTLRSQLKSIKIQNDTLREQQKITRIELYNHIERIKPNFQLDYSASKRLDRKNNLEMMFSFGFILKNHARNVKISCDSEITSMVKKHQFPIEQEIVNDGETLRVILAEAKNVVITDSQKGYFDLFLIFSICFDDIEGNSYVQIIDLIDLGGQDTYILNGPSTRQI